MSSRPPSMPEEQEPTDLAQALFAEEFTQTTQTIDARNLPRWIYLTSFDYGATSLLEQLAPLAREPLTDVVRYAAIFRLAAQVTSEDYSGVPDDQAEAWIEFFHDMLEQPLDSMLLDNITSALAKLEE